MRRLINICLFLYILAVHSISVQAGQITIQSVTLENWQDTRTNVELWLFVDQPFIRSDGKPVLSGGPGNKIAFQRIHCTVNTINKTITIPAFQLWSTTDGLDIDTAQYSAYFFTDKGVMIKAYENFSDGFRLPTTIASMSGCAPAGACATWADIRAYNFSKVVTNNPAVYTKDEINRVIAAIQQALQTITAGAPSSGSFITRVEESGLSNETRLDQFPAGALLKHAGGGNLAAAGAGADFEAPLTFSLPLSRAGNAISLNPLSNTHIASGAAIALNKLAPLASSRAVVTDGSGFFSVSPVTSIELGHLAGVTGPIQTQLDAKAPATRLLSAGTGLSGGGDLSADRTFSVLPDSTTQRTDVLNNGALVSTRKAINFIPGSNVSLTITDNSASNRLDISIAASSSAGSGWDQLTGPAADLALSHGSNKTTFTWGSATGSSDLFTLTDSAGNTGSGHMLAVQTGSSSAVKPLLLTAGGSVNGIEMNTAGVMAPIGSGGITANALSGVSSNGLQVRTGAGSFASRSLLAPAAGIAISNPDGVTGNPQLGLADDLAGVEGIGTTGLAARSAANTWTTRSIIAGSSNITVSNGDGVAGNPAIDIGANVLTNSSTHSLTNKTIDSEAAGNTLVTTSKIWIDAAGAIGATASSNWDLPVSGAPDAAVIAGTNIIQPVLDFPDGASDLIAQRTIRLPSDWTGSIDVTFKWLSPATSGNVVWGVSTACVGDGETNDPSFNTYNDVTDAAKGTANQTNDASITGITTTGCAPGELLHIRIARRLSQSADTMAGTARLIGVEFTLRRAQ